MNKIANLLKNKSVFFLKLSLIFAIFLSACSPKIDPVSGKNEDFEPNAFERAKKYARDNPVFLDPKNNKKNEFDFATSNVLWRATLQSLEFIPLVNVDYSAGIIIYDWYSRENNSQEQIKLTVQFVGTELRSDSIKILAYKKICDSLNKCSNVNVDQKFITDIKDNIINTARSIKIEEAKKNKK